MSTNASSNTHAHHEHGHHGHHQAHAHGHGHHHHGHAHDFAEANKQHFDQHAEEFDNWPQAIERSARSALAIRDAVSLNKEETTALEFACGTGLVIKWLIPYVKEIVGIDISSALVERCNKRLKEEGAGEGSYAITANIETDNDVLAGKKFDLVYCTSAYHHFEDPEKITKLLAGYLKPGGALVIIDQIAKPGDVVPESHRSCVVRVGFNEEDIKPFYDAAGLQFASYGQVQPDEKDADLFVAKGFLPA